MTEPRIDRRILYGALVLAAAWRLGFLSWVGPDVDADETVVGVMALRIARFAEFPVWYAGQQYMGALEAYLLAPVVALLGPTPWAIKLVALGLSLVQVGTGVVLADRLSGRAGAMFAGLLLACPPLFLTAWSLKLRGGFVSLWALGQLLWVVTLVIDERGWTTRRGLAWGLVAGVATWTNLLAFPYVAAAGLFLLVRGALRTPRSWGLASAGFVAGAAPLLGWNVVHPLATLRALPAAGGGAPLDHPSLLATRHLPILLGLRVPWAAHVPSSWEPVAFAGLLAAVLTVAWRWRRGSPKAAYLLGFFLLAYLGCVLFSGFGHETEPRYAAVLGVLLGVVPAVALATSWERRRVGRAFAILVAATIVLGHARSIALESRVAPMAPGHLHSSGNHDPAPLVRLLDREGVTLVVAEYWAGLPIAFATGERIGVMTWPWRLGRAERFRSGERRAWAFRSAGERAVVPAFKADLESRAVAYRTVDEAGWLLVIVDGGRPAPELWTGTTSEPRPGGALGPHTVPANVFDRNYLSRWSTHAPQRPGQWLELELGAPRTVSELRCLFGSGDAPRGLRAETSVDGTRWEPAWTGLPSEHWIAAISPRSARRLRLEQTGSSPYRWWSVLECDVR